MDEQRITEVLQTSQIREAEAWTAFEARFDKQFPMPEKASVRLMQAIGWQFIATTFQSVSSVLLASLRTAQMFYDASAGSNWIIQFVEAAAAILAVELGIVIFATIKSETKNSAHDVEDLNRALNVSTKLLNVGIGAGVFVSIVAGLGVSFQGFGLDVTFFKWILAITMGIGASVIAWVSGDILGAMLARFSNARLAAGHEYSQELVKRNGIKNEMWEKAPERKIAVSQLTEMKALLEAQRRTAVPASSRQPSEPATPRSQARSHNNDVRGKVYEYLDQILRAEGRVPGPSEVADALKVAKGYVGGKDGVIKQWMAERGVNIPTSETTSEEPVELPANEVVSEA